MSLLLLLLLLSACGCENSVLQEVASPDGLHKAIVFERDCGATTGPNIQLSVVSRGGAAEGEGNAFVLDMQHDTTLAETDARRLVGVTWLSPSTLLIKHDPRLRIFKNEQRVEGISIQYESTAP